MKFSWIPSIIATVMSIIVLIISRYFENPLDFKIGVITGVIFTVIMVLETWWYYHSRRY